jgi:hypothetical protein
VVVPPRDGDHALDDGHDRPQVRQARGRVEVGGEALRAGAVQPVADGRGEQRRRRHDRQPVVHAGRGNARHRGVVAGLREQHHTRSRHPLAAHARSRSRRAAGARFVEHAEFWPHLRHGVPQRFAVALGLDDRAQTGELAAGRFAQHRIRDADDDCRHRGLAAAQQIDGFVYERGRRDRPGQRARCRQSVRAGAFEQRRPEASAASAASDVRPATRAHHGVGMPAHRSQG